MRVKVILLAGLAILFMLGGLVTLTLPAPFEGPILYTLNEGHAVSLMDGVGSTLITLGCLVAWVAGILWQRWVYAA